MSPPPPPETQGTAPSALDQLIALLAARRHPSALDRYASRPWGEIARLARQHQVEPLLAQVVRQFDLDVPDELRVGLRQRVYQTTAANAWLFIELGRVLDALGEAGVPVILLKGAALARAVYDDPGLRPMGDLDLLVPHALAGRAQTAVAALGYAADRPEIRPGARLAFESQVMLRRLRRPETAIEIHWGLLDAPYYEARLPMAWFWETARPIALDARRTALTLGPEAQLLHLCAHLVLHHDQDQAPALRWRLDIAECLHVFAGDIDWPRLLDQARAFDLLIPLQRELPRAAGAWGAPLPAAARQALGALTPSRAEVAMQGRFGSDDRSAARRLADDLAGMQGWRRRARWAWINLFPSVEYMRRRYRVRHPWLVPLYYPYRWVVGWRRP